MLQRRAVVAVVVLALAVLRDEWRAFGAPPAAIGQPGVNGRTDVDGLPLPAGALARLGTTRFRTGPMWRTGIAFTAGGKEVFAASDEGEIRCWETSSGRLVRTMNTGGRSIRGLAASADGKIAATLETHWDRESSTSSQFLRVWNVGAGKEVCSIAKTDRFGEETLAVSPDGATIVTSERDGTLSVWDVAARAVVLKERLLDRAGAVARFSSNGKTLMISGRDSVYLWDWLAGTPPRLVSSYETRLESAALSPDGKMLAISIWGRPIELRQLPEGQVVRQLIAREPSANTVREIAFSPDGRRLAAVCNNHKTIDLWDLATGQRVLRLATSPDAARSLAFSPDSRLLAASDSFHAVRVWDLSTGKPLVEEPPGHRASVSCLAFLGQSRQVATSSDDATVRVWDAQTGRQQRQMEHRSEEPGGNTIWVRGMTVSHSGKLIASSSLDDTVRVWESGTGKELYRLPGHGRLGGHRALAFTSDDQRLVSWGDDMYLRVWDMRTGKALAEWLLEPRGIDMPEDEQPKRDAMMFKFDLEQSAFSPDGRWLVLKMGDFHVFDAENGKEVTSFPGADGHLTSLAVSPDGKTFLASAYGRSMPSESADSRVRPTPAPPMLRLWGRGEGNRLWQQILPLNSSVGPLAFSPDGTLFASATGREPAEIRIWTTAGRKEVLRWRDLPSASAGLAFSSDNRLFVAGLRDGTALVWELPADLGKR